METSLALTASPCNGLFNASSVVLLAACKAATLTPSALGRNITTTEIESPGTRENPPAGDTTEKSAASAPVIYNESTFTERLLVLRRVSVVSLAQSSRPSP